MKLTIFFLSIVSNDSTKIFSVDLYHDFKFVNLL